MSTVTQVLNTLSAIAAFGAAGLWWHASRAIVPSDYTGPIVPGQSYISFHGGRDPVGVTKTGRRFNLIATLALQGNLNTYAALAAAAAAALQGVALFLPNTEASPQCECIAAQTRTSQPTLASAIQPADHSKRTAPSPNH
jgi:hypothetical protein